METSFAPTVPVKKALFATFPAASVAEHDTVDVTVANAFIEESGNRGKAPSDTRLLKIYTSSPGRR